MTLNITLVSKWGLSTKAPTFKLAQEQPPWLVIANRRHWHRSFRAELLSIKIAASTWDLPNPSAVLSVSNDDQGRGIGT
jgi:hypothetical protein